MFTVEELRFEVSKLRSTYEVLKKSMPLKVGIKDDIKPLIASNVDIDLVMRRLVDNYCYQKNLSKGGARHDLEGNAVGEITDGEKKGANARKKVLSKDSYKMRKARKKALALKPRRFKSVLTLKSQTIQSGH